MFIRELLQALNSRKIPYCLVGGYALAFHGIVRATMDIDLSVHVDRKTLIGVESALESIGLRSRLPIRAEEVAEFREEYIVERNLITWTFVDFSNPTRQVDVLIRYPLDSLEVETIRWNGEKVRVATLRSLRKMKLEAGRTQDLADVEKIDAKLKEKKRLLNLKDPLRRTA